MNSDKRIKNGITFVFLLFLSTVFLFPIYLVILNSFKSKFNIVGSPFKFPDKDTFVGIENYVNGIRMSDLIPSFLRTLIITVGSVLVIVFFTSMAAWFIVRVKSKFTKTIYYLFLFSMIVPFQMVMFTMVYICTKLGLNSVLGIIPVYLGFGSGMSVFLFAGFIRSSRNRFIVITFGVRSEHHIITHVSHAQTKVHIVKGDGKILVEPVCPFVSLSCHKHTGGGDAG